MLLSIPASSAASESVASIMGRINSPSRSCLLPKNLIAEVTIAMNKNLFESEDHLIERSIHFLKYPPSDLDLETSTDDESEEDS